MKISENLGFIKFITYYLQIYDYLGFKMQLLQINFWLELFCLMSLKM